MKVLISFLAAGTLAWLPAAEGKWTPDQILQFDAAYLKQQGLVIPPDRLWNPATGKGLLSAVISTGGCSGAFISANGLFLTNHHCLFGIVQEHSTSAHDYITNGFLASSPAEELRGRGARITMPHRFTDVTAKVLAAVPAGADDRARFKAIERTQTELAVECEKQKGHRCRTSSFDGGMRYLLVDSVEISDVRLVYAPPRSVGEFGGEVDNFAWPRHTGDFSIGRAYVDGAPYHPDFHIPIAKNGVKAGDFVMVMGYPGITYRSLTAPEMAERRDLFFTRRVDLFGEWIQILEQASSENKDAAIAVAAHMKSLNNTWKNAQGQLEGFARGRLLEKQEQSDRMVLASPKATREVREAYQGLTAMIEEQRKTWERDFLLTNLASGSKALYFATAVARAALERAKPDDQRDPQYTERELPRLFERLDRDQSSVWVPADRKLFASYLKRRGGDADAARIEAMYAGTKVLDPAERKKMYSESAAQLHARRDPFLEYGFEQAVELQGLRERQDRWSGTVSRLRPVWRGAVIAQAGKPVAPDANSTLRVSFAHIRGYEPRDAMIYKPLSTMTGMLEKFTGKEPFDAPAEVRAAAKQRDFGPYLDPELKDLPIDFLADADTTGGNSGSPVVNGRGELVGVNFDRVWENVANDFGYNPAIARNISVDVRYLLWMLDRVSHGQSLLRELGFFE